MTVNDWWRQMTPDDDAGVVDKSLTHAMLEAGEVRLTLPEATCVGLGRLSADVTLVHGADRFTATWNSRSRMLTGEALRDALQLSGTDGGRIRLRASGDVIELDLRHAASPRSSDLTRAASATQPILPPHARARASRRPANVSEARLRIPDRSEYEWTRSVGIHLGARERLEEAIADGGWDSPELLALRLRGERLAAANDVGELLAMDLSNIDYMPHQEAAAVTALGAMRGRAILADEAGLGKTIEAGLVMKELMLGGFARRVLVICPATLRDHWQSELREKFYEKFTVVTSGADPALADDRLIVSLQLATHQQEKLTAVPWDLVIVDEAHRVAHADAVDSRALLESLDSRYKLFLTATPVRTDLLELYRLVELVRPGTFHSETEFRDRFLQSGSDHVPSDAASLRQIVSEVMIRTTREQARLVHITRAAVDISIELSPKEREAYSICTNVLRRVLDRPEDNFRRRQLAHRLTSSPRSLASTVLKLADNVGVPEAEQQLRAVGDLLIDVGLTSRQRQLIKLLNEWTLDTETKGRVVVFTQHYETLHDLARILTEQGIDVAIHHGGLTAAARQRAIEQFRSTSQVLLSTDAGAEGLDLHFANCVVNYDLPWNPLRIEQRIGRVQRTSQPRDTVHVANFYARDTVDEHVHTILRDQLRLSELLFGQVVTILGELDHDAEQSFEARVLDALLAVDDREMEHKLQRLGEQVDRAYRQWRDDDSLPGGHLDAWLIDRSSRDEAAGPATELHTEPTLRTRQRRGEVREFAIGVLQAIGADIYFNSVDDEFVAARLPEGFAESVGGREDLKLVFSPQGLDAHRDAELCAVGSEIFEELVAILHERGELIGRVPEFPADPDEPAFAHAPDVRMVGRTILGPQQWGAEVTWRLRASGPASGLEILSTTIGDVDRYRTDAHRALHPNEPLPKSARSAKSIVHWATNASIPALQRRQAEIEHQLVGDDELDLDRSIGAPPTAELRADPLSIEFVGSPSLDVVERWASVSGVEVDVAYTWAVGTSPAVMASDGRAIEVLDICADAHMVDRAAVATCGSCASKRCTSCIDPLEPCLACHRSMCRHCVTDLLVCRDCFTPKRDQFYDDDGRVAWRLGSGSLLSVGAMSARIDAGPLLVDPTTETEGMRRLRAYSRKVGLSEEVGLRVEQLVPAPLPSAILGPRIDDHYEWNVDRGADSSVDPRGFALLPECPPDDTRSLEDVGLLALVTRLRALEAPPVAPQLVAVPVRTTTWIEFDSDELCVVRRVERAGEAVAEFRARCRLAAPADAGRSDLACVAVGSTESVQVVRLNGSFILDWRDVGSWFVPGRAGVSEGTERALAAVARQAGVSAAGAVGISRTAGWARDLPSPAAAALVESQQSESWVMVPSPEAEWLLDADLPSVGVIPAEVVHGEMPASMANALRTLVAQAGFESAPVAAYRLAVDVSATWVGRSVATRTYRVFSGEPIGPALDDSGAPATDFEIDDLGHLHVPGRTWACRSCGRHRCGGCGDAGAIDDCATCGQPACGDCRSQPRISVPVVSCARCAARSCGHCRRTIALASCGVCGRSICGDCRRDRLCIECASPSRVPEFDDDGLVAWRIGGGALARVGETFVTIGDRWLVTTPHEHMAELTPRLWAFAHAAGRRIDAGLHTEETVPFPAIDNVMCISSRLDYTWRFDDSRGGAVDARSLEFLPDASLGDAVTPADPNLCEWVNARGAVERPGVAPRVVATPVRTTSWIEVADSGLRYATRTEAVGREQVEEREPIDIRAVHDVARPEVVGAAFAGGRRLEIRRVNRSLEIELEDAGTWFLAGDPSVDEAIERALAIAGHRLGVARGAAVGVVRPSGEGVQLPSPDAAPLLHVNVERSWLAVSAQDADWVTRDDFQSLGIEPATATLPVVPATIAKAVRQSLARTVRLPQLFALRQQLEATATWAGRTTATRVVKGLADEPIEPTLDDTGASAADFEIDDLGHLHVPGQTWACPSCERHRCRGCGDAGAIDDCATCGQTACGDCRAQEYVEITVDVCARCSARSCGRCRRTIELRACVLCERSICPDCRPAGVCVDCAAPSRAPEHDVDGLIAWRIGDDTIALVGESFVSIGDRSLMTAAPATPLMPRLWAFAKNAGRRVDAGLRAESPPPTVVVLDVIGLSTRLDYVWRFADGGGDVDVGALQLLPDHAPDDSVVPADEATVAWAAARRDDEAPAPPPQVVAIPVRTTSWLAMSDASLVLMKRVDALDGDTTESQQRVDLQPVNDASARDVVGEAYVDGRRLQVRRLNRSFILELDDVGAWFLAGDADVDESVERAVANATDRVAGDRDCGVGIVRPVDEADVVPSPAAAPLQSADIARSWLAVPVLHADWITRRDLESLGVAAATAEHRVVPRAMADGLRRVVADSVRTPSLFGLRQRLDVTATWHGRVPATRVVRVLSGDSVEPDLDDTGAPSADFEIDDLGHLHAVGQGWVCR
ncbi:MAG: SNF2-related protein, partial [Acidimicrobiales bacterium]